MGWTWDPNKNRLNYLKHGLDFDVAKAVFEDRMAISRRDLHLGEERWQIIGMVGRTTIIVIYSLENANGDEESGRIISARKATSRERKAYEEGDF
jgi:uncharacterized protein